MLDLPKVLITPWITSGGDPMSIYSPDRQEGELSDGSSTIFPREP